ncbi:hypothetical protein [Pseudomonas sp. EMN2]|uniref:hypothetical protein n=1 Tax=Pseudomonas sp. EMN2 TaxID=2615212 RepID=UPI00129AD00F|nr:hypothetical protein [Pseudomonas sp. EMN2]
MDRGYRTGRKGQQFGIPKPKRGLCPRCGKKGLTRWKPTPNGMFRDCQYCLLGQGHHTWELQQAALAAQVAGEVPPAP